MRYPASEKLEIIRLVEQSHFPAKRTLEMLGIPKTTFYRWYERYRAFGGEPCAPLVQAQWRAASRIAVRIRAGSGTGSLTMCARR
jgi:transposase-like protein